MVQRTAGIRGQRRGVNWIWAVLLISLALTVGDYMGGSPLSSVPSTAIVSKWDDSGSTWAAEVGPDYRSGTVENGILPSVTDGLYRIRIPYESDDLYTLHLNVMNLTDIAGTYEDFNLCLGVAPAPEEYGGLIQDRETFLEGARNWKIAEPHCGLLSSDNGHVDINVDPLFGTATDNVGRTSLSTDAGAMTWRVLDIGVIDGAFRQRPGAHETPVRLHLHVEPI